MNLQSEIPLEYMIVLSTAVFFIGLVGVVIRRNLITMLMGIELMLNAVNINLLAFWRYVRPGDPTGQIFAIFVLAVAAAEAAVGLALIISIYRTRSTINVDQIDMLKG